MISFDISFDKIRIERPLPIADKKDDLQRPLLKGLKHVFKILAPYFWGPKHTDIWGIGRFVAKVAGKNTIDTRCADGNWLCLPLPVYTSHFLYGPDHKRFNKDNICPLIKKLAKLGTVAIDVGASCGQEVVALSWAVGPEGLVYSFEPSMSFEALVRTVALNDLKNVVCINAGCGDKNAFIGNGGKGDEYFIGTELTYAETGIPVIRIDDFLRFMAEKRPVSLIKIDTDGFEYEVIQGAAETIESSNPEIIAEFEPQFDYSGLQKEAVLKRYKAMGFEVQKIQTSSVTLNDNELSAYLEEMRNPENMIAHDIVLRKAK